MRRTVDIRASAVGLVVRLGMGAVEYTHGVTHIVGAKLVPLLSMRCVGMFYVKKLTITFVEISWWMFTALSKLSPEYLSLDLPLHHQLSICSCHVVFRWPELSESHNNK